MTKFCLKVDRPQRSKMLELKKIAFESRLSKLPRLSERPNLLKMVEPHRLQLPQKENPVCINCNAKLTFESDFCRKVKVCSACLKTHAVVEEAINIHFEQKKLHVMKGNLGGRIKH